jgi:hypothetical protein
VTARLIPTLDLHPDTAERALIGYEHAQRLNADGSSIEPNQWGDRRI